MLTKPLLLIVDDELAILKTLKESLEDEGFRVETLSDGKKAIDIVGQLLPDLILLDIFMPNCNGLEILTKIKKEYPHQKVIVISGFGTIPIALEAIQSGAIDFIEKPLNLDEILNKINFLKMSEKDYANKKQNELFDYEKFGIVGRSYLFQEFMYELNKLATLNFPVIIYGPCGIGKTLFANYIHQQSNFSGGKMLTIDCLNKTDQQVFKQTKLAFAETAGTLFVKNIQALDLTTQHKLLELINDSNSTFRFVCSAKKSLFNLVQQGLFSEALFYKINIAPIEIASLRKRQFDIPLLVSFFLQAACEAENKKIAFANSAIRTIRNYDWPGNVLQLRQFIELMVHVNKNGKLISVLDVGNYLPSSTSVHVEEQMFNRFISLQDALNCFERNFILHSLKKNKYDLSQTSNSLNLDISNLRDKLVALNIPIET